MQNLVIVESPTKARTLQRFLGSKYKIEASMGHIRDLPKSEVGIDIENNFEPKYIIPRDKRKRVNELKKLAQGADTLWLATDPDREGEAIAWHIAELLRNSKDPKSKKPTDQILKRVVFHEITEEAIKDAFNHPKDLDMQLVDAQQARRVLDRLVGYKLSPLLWQKIKRGLSAGRVQSVALRLIAEREREVKAFNPVEYWNIEAELESSNKNQESRFKATLIEQAGKKLEIKNEKEARGHESALKEASYSVSKITKKEVRRNPYPPFTTSTLQQGAANRLGMSAKKTMMLAQHLYEHGFITYMRTDSVNLAPSAITSVRDYITKNLGKAYLPSAPRMYKAKSKNAQEAHEAIRPTKVELLSSEIRESGGLTKEHVRLYDLIWKRFVACQTAEAVMDQTTIDVSASGDYIFRASGSVIKFDGWLKLYGKNPESSDKSPEDEEQDKEKILPQLTEGELLKLLELLPTQHFTEPPPRFNEASLIKKLEELGIGRPSTYAPILSTIQERYYVERIDRRFIPTELGFTVNDFIVEYFPEIVDYQFTAQMEDNLDEIARGEREWKPTIKEFFVPFERQLEKTEATAKRVEMPVEKVGRVCPTCGKDLIIRVGKFGKFIACSGFPDCKYTETIEEKIDAKCPDDGGEIIVRRTKKGRTFYGCKNWPNCKFASWNKPKSENPDPTIVTQS
jgi:DNA topoisomerase I